MADQVTQDVPESASARRKRRRRSRKDEPKGFGGWVTSVRADRALFMAMFALAVAYAVTAGYMVWTATLGYGDAWMGMSKAEARYVLGPPPVTSAADAHWRYSDGGTLVDVRFDHSGKIEAVSCTEAANSLKSCPAKLGLHIGTTERDLILRIGGADRNWIDGQDKFKRYDGLGLTFRLRRTIVVEIIQERKSGLLDLSRRILWVLMP